MNPNLPNTGQNNGTFTYPTLGATASDTPVSQPIQPAPTQAAGVSPDTATLPAQPVNPVGMGVTQVPVANPLTDPTVAAPVSNEATDDAVKEETSTEAQPTENSNPLEALANKLSNLKEEFIGESSQDVSAPQTEPVPVEPIQPSVSVNDSMPPAQVMPTPEVNEISTATPFNPSSLVQQPAAPTLPSEMPSEAVAVEPTGKSLEEILKEENKSEGAPAVTGQSYQYTIEQLLDLVVERDASDLHITVGYPVMIRVDGALQNVSEQIVTPEQANDLILPVLPEQKKELLEVNREVDLAYAHGENARFRINAYYQKQTLAAAFRLIPNRIRSIDELKLPQIYHQIAKLKQGLVLVTGPTGSGKSTTLASILQEINLTRPDHMITIEDPIEYVFPKAMAMVDQREMHEDTHSWEIALKSALRQDPDVMLVGEMRDFETIASAITLAETGHLVFATLHTNSASQTVDRIIDVFPEHQQPQIRAQLSHVIEAVIAQRLIPLPSGGRMAVSEIMLANPAVRNLIREAKTHQLDNVIRTSADIGMVSLEHSLVKLVRENVITMDLAQEYAVHPEEVVRLLKS